MAIAFRSRRLFGWARENVVAIAIVAVAVAVAWFFAYVTLVHTPSMGLPLDDSYIYLTYAKQFGRGQPFTYFPGGGYSAGSTSVLWPMVLAPFWTLGARGHALVWVSYGMCTALYAGVAVLAYRLVFTIMGRVIPGLLAALMVLSIAPFTWCALSGMEVAFASALVIATFLMLATAKTVRPSKLMIACLVATSLSRPEAILLVGAITVAKAGGRVWARDLRGTAWWLSPLIAPALWLLANRAIAGNFFPNTGVAKSHFYLPGFDWTYWWDTVDVLREKLVKFLYRDPASPLVWPRMIAWLQLIGSVRILLWAHRDRKWLPAILLVVAPFVLMFAVVASSGLWNFQNYRYIAPALPLIMIIAGCGLAPPRWLPAQIDLFEPIIRRLWLAVTAVIVVLFVRAGLPRLRADALLFAQGAMDTNTQVVTIGEYIHRKLPDASVMFHDAGAIAYYGDGKVYDMLGLVTNHQAGIANNGPGSRFEFLESLPPEQRPTHFAYYPGWLGSAEWFGPVLLDTPLRPGFEPRRMVGDHDMQVIVANWDHAHTGERPLLEHPGWAVVDRIDVADLASERAHGWVGRIGRRRFGDPTARWSVVERETFGVGLVIDGGRTIRDGGERFSVSIDPNKPTRVVIRTGGQRAYGFNEAIIEPVTLRLLAGDQDLGSVTISPPDGTFSELTFKLPPGALASSHGELRAEASGLYRVFHWFVLQPE
ncbi:MAG: hypothetical protein JWO36_1857 [Myxococcales bacterium]|nr:hypothetical protein [Myxococcales bacterium]